MKIGIFDHVESAGDRAVSTLFDERLTFAQAADEAGIYCLHVAEHHATPLNMVPVPGVYLGALARLTKRMRIGTMVYLLPLYSPLRLTEEICMLDHLSHGRLEVGIGRGISPFELNYHKVAPDDSRDIFIDAYQCLSAGLTQDTLTYTGKYFTYKDVPVALKPLQQPHAAFWYASSNTTGSAWAGEQGMHFTSNGPIARAKENIDVFRTALAKRGRPAQPKAEFSGGTAIGVSRNVVVADTDEEAARIAKPAVLHQLRNLTWLRDRNVGSDLAHRLGGIAHAESYEAAVKQGTVIAGSPETVRAEIERNVDALGVNYLLTYPFFGTMTLPQALRSLALFATEVMPKIKDL